MDSNMISDCFVVEAPAAIAPPQPASFSNRGPVRGRISISNESFVSASMHHENFGDWGSINNPSQSFSNHDGKANDPFSEQKEEEGDGFNVIERRVVPKLPVSKREIRKVTTSEQSQPTIIFETDQDILMSPMAMGSPVTNSIRSFNKSRAEPVRKVQRSVSDSGSFSQRDTVEELDTKSPSTSFRSLFRDQQGSEKSLSFSHRRKPISNRPLLRQIGERRKSYRNLSLDEDNKDELPLQHTPPNRALLMQIGERRKSYRNLSLEEDDDEPRRTPPNRALLMQIGERRRSYRNLIMDEDEDRPPTQPQRQPPTPTSILQNLASDDDEPFEGTLPLKAEPEPVALKKRSTSRDRLNKMRSEDQDADGGDQTHPKPTRKSSSRRLTSRKMSLSDSNRSNGTKSSKASRAIKASTKRMSRPMDEEIEFYVDPSSPTKTSMSSGDPERNTMLAEVRRQKRLAEKGVRRSNSGKSLDGSREKSKQSKKKSSRESHGTSDELNKHTNRCKNRRTVGRRASMTGNIVDMEDEPPREKRRSSMDHLKSDTTESRPKERRRRNTMDHYRPSPTQSVSPMDERKKSRSKSDIKALSNGDMTLSSHVSGKESSIFSTRIPFGEEGTETTKGTEESREMTNPDRGRPLSRKSSMEKVKSKERRSNSSKRIVGRSRSGLERERQRSKSRQRQPEREDKTVTVAEILAVVASAHQPSSRARRSRSNTIDTIDASSKSGGIDISNSSNLFDISSRSGNASLTTSTKSDFSRDSYSPTSKNRKKPRSRTRQKDSNTSFNKIRKGKRVEHHPGEEASQEESMKKKKDKPVVVGKESRHRWGGRRGSAR